MNLGEDILKRDKLIIFIFNFSFLSLIFRMSFPFFKYPFILSYVFLFVYVFLHKKRLHENLINFFKNYLLVIIVFILIILELFYSDKIFISIIKDILNIFIILSLFFVSTIFIESKAQVKYFFMNFNIQVIAFATVISCVLFSYQIDIIPTSFPFSLIMPSLYSLNNKEVFIDTNFSLIPMFLAFFAMLFFIKNYYSLKKIILFSSLLFFYFFNILLSGSRRGVFLLSIVLLLYLLLQLASMFLRNDFLKDFTNKTKLLTFSFIIVPCVVFIIYNLSFKSNSDFLSFVGSKNIPAVRDRVTRNALRYIRIVDKDYDYVKFYSKLWAIEFDPKDPDSGWGGNVHKTIFPLTGNNIEIVPNNVKGYMMDSTSDVICTWNNSAYSRTLLYNQIVKDRYIHAYVYCFISNDFNGDLASIELVGQKKIISSAEYDLKKKDCWQKLELVTECKSDTVELALWFSKYASKDFSSLKGYVIFAYPILNILKDTNNITDTSYYNISSINHKIEIKKLEIDSTISEPKIITNSGNFKNNDPIRNCISNIFIEDTIYHPYKSKLKDNYSKVKFGDDRISRWSFALEIYIKEYNLYEKILGGGFNFLNWYGYVFLKDKSKSDYPHNPFLYILLYSGIIGLLLYIFLLYKVFFYYIKHIREYYLFFIFFLITFFFTFFSGGNPFDPPIMGFFIILPFFIHYVHSIDSYNSNKNGSLKL